jgi:hypothetical protein
MTKVRLEPKRRPDFNIAFEKGSRQNGFLTGAGKYFHLGLLHIQHSIRELLFQSTLFDQEDDVRAG